METLLQDARYGLRMTRKSPGLTAVAVAAMALGIGACSAVFSVANAVLINPLPFSDPDSIVMIWETDLKNGADKTIVSPANYLDWKDQSSVFENMSAWRFWFFNLTGESEPERVQGLQVASDFFPLLRVKAALGRTFLPEEETAGHDKVVVISHELWRRRFASDSNVIGRSVAIDGEQFNIIGVLPEDFRLFQVLDRNLELWVPLVLDRGKVNRKDYSINVYGRVKRGFSIAQAQAEMDAIARRLEEAHPETNNGRGAKAVSLPEQLSQRVRPALLMLSGAVLLVLLIACVDVANLLLARAAERRKEIALREALGASRYRIFRQLLIEGLMLSVSGGALGLLAALWGVDLLNALIPHSAVPRIGAFRIDGGALCFTLALSILTGALIGAAPCLQLSKLDLTLWLNEGAKTMTTSRRGRRIQNLLVISEIAFALVLLAGAGLAIRSSIRLQSFDRGFDSANILTMQVWLPETNYRDGSRAADFYRQTLQRIAALPGVESASAINFLPLSKLWDSVGFAIEGRSPSLGTQLAARYYVIGPDYFRTMRIPLLKGRQLSEQDRSAVLINETMARRFWPDEDPVGKLIKPNFPKAKAPWRPMSDAAPLTIIGVVGDVKEDGLFDASSPEIYLPYYQNPSMLMNLVIRSSSDPIRLADSVRKEVWAVDKDQPVFNVKTMEDAIAGSFTQLRVFTLLLGAFAAIAIVLAAIGLYGVTAYSVSRRTNEIGIRMALGAQSADVVRLIIRQGMFLILTGVLIGIAGAAALTRAMSGFLFGVSAADPATFAAVALFLTAVSFTACYVPARRAMKVDPMVALRYE